MPMHPRPHATTDAASDTGSARFGKLAAGLLSATLLSAVAWPLRQNWRTPPVDSFPLSYYPMFAKKRPGVLRVHYLVGLDAEQRRYPLPYTFAGSGGFNQVRKQINVRVRQGSGAELCAYASRRVAARDDARYTSITTIQLVTGRYRLRRYMAGRDALVDETVVATTAVRRTRGTGAEATRG